VQWTCAVDLCSGFPETQLVTPSPNELDGLCDHPNMCHIDGQLRRYSLVMTFFPLLQNDSKDTYFIRFGIQSARERTSFVVFRAISAPFSPSSPLLFNVPLLFI
jgi:hypothetical protein